jgi:hypothetical protein
MASEVVNELFITLKYLFIHLLEIKLLLNLVWYPLLVRVIQNFKIWYPNILNQNT